MREQRRIIHFINSFTELSGGVGTALQLLISSYPKLKHEIVCLRDNGKILACDSIVYEFKRTGPFSLSYSKSLKNFLKRYKDQRGVQFHIHGLWSGMNYSLMRFLSKSKISFVISVHGMLSPHALSRRFLIKKIMYILSERWLLLNAKYIICLNESEVAAVKKILDKGLANIVILPHPFNFNLTEKKIEDIWDRKTNDEIVFLYLGRVHQTKGIMELVQAFTLAKSQNTFDRILNIVGPANNYDTGILNEASSAHSHRIKYLGPLYGINKENEFRDAHAIVLPSMTEGLPVSLIEAASYGLPIIATHQCNMPWIERSSSGYLYDYYDNGIERIADCMMSVNHSDLRKKGMNAYRGAKGIYESSLIAKLLDQIYS